MLKQMKKVEQKDIMKKLLIIICFLTSLNSFACMEMVGKYVDCADPTFKLDIKPRRNKEFTVVILEKGKLNEIVYGCTNDRLVYKKVIFGNGIISTLSKSDEGVVNTTTFVGLVSDLLKEMGTTLPDSKLCKE